MIVQALKWNGDIDGFLELVDQRMLPEEFVELLCRSVEQLFEAIRTLTVRGAPAIGVAAGYGPVLSLQKINQDCNLTQALAEVQKTVEYLATSRPTAVNLFWALERIRQKAEQFVDANPDSDVLSLRKVLLAEANTTYAEDVEMCLKIGRNGQKLIPDSAGILTHCNAGALATAGQGTALSVLYEAQKSGKKFKVFVDETRPLLQGARLTAWELTQAGIETTVICDNMAGWLMKQGKINAVITGADRIASNGDVANKIGTYSLSILAKEHNVPFYVAAPSSTFDLSIKSGAEIPIEQRDPQEVTTFAGVKTAPEKVPAYNPAFDITDAHNITAIITEKAVIENPNTDRITQLLAPNSEKDVS